MEERVVELLSHSSIFSSVSLEVIRELLASSTQVELTQNEILFYQGDMADSAYFLLEGKLVAELTSFKGENRIIGHIDPGEMVGELGALIEESRSLTIRAIRPSQLIKIPAKRLVDICHRFPSVMFAVLHPVITRSRNMLQMMTSEKINRHIVVMPINAHCDLAQFSRELGLFSENNEGTKIISDFDAGLIEATFTPAEIAGRLEGLYESSPSVKRYVYILKSHDSSLSKHILRKADKVYVISHAAGVLEMDQHVRDKLNSSHHNLSNDPALILLHPENAEQPQHTAAWLKLFPFSLFHHVRFGVKRDYSRLLRFMRDKAVGLVMGGGGTRGWAHLGVIKALREMRVPIDMVGGTSVGAAVAACYAIEQEYEGMYQRFYRIIVESHGTIAWRSLTWPVISLFNAKKYTEAHQNAFGDRRLEDVWIPCFCVSSNLSTNTESVHREGLIWEITRASTSIPGLIPPMLLNGEIHYDGGLLNNLPVDVMRQFLGKRSRVIAAELNSFVPHPAHYDFPPILTFLDVMKSKLGFSQKKYQFPHFMDTFLQALFAGSLMKANQNSLAANVFVTLDLHQFSLLKSNPEQAEELIDIGYRETVKQFEEATNK